MIMQLSDKAQASLNTVIARFQSGDLSPVVAIVRIRRDPNDTRPSQRWSLSNQVIAYIQAQGELDCRGFRQWEAAGRKVKQGAKAVFILGPCTRKTADENGAETIRICGFKSIPVFPVYATEGEPLPTFNYDPPQLPPLHAVAQRLGVSVSYGPVPDAYGWYNRNRKHIRLGTHNEKTFFHELAHAAHDKLEGGKGGQVPAQETVAEFTAAVLMQLYGLPDQSGNTWDYIARYHSDPLTAIYQALSTVEKVLALILQ
jgi:hypothetical protein